MQNILILHSDQAAAGTLSGGSWEASLPLANMQTDRLSQRARSTDAELASTQFVVTMPAVEFGFRAIVLGPTNLSAAHKYRVRAFNDAGLTSGVYDSGWVEGGERVEFGSLPWGHLSLWTGYLPIDDSERGAWLIHVLDPVTWPTGVSERFWKIEIDDTTNDNGSVEIGRVFFGIPWQPSLNFTPANGLTFRNNALSQTALSGAKSFWRRTNPRVFRFGFDTLAAADLHDEGYELMREAGFDGQVFVIPDPTADSITLGRRSFLGTIATMDGIALAAGDYGAIGFEIEEQL